MSLRATRYRKGALPRAAALTLVAPFCRTEPLGARAANMGRGARRLRPALGWDRQHGKFDVEISIYRHLTMRNPETGVTSGAETQAEAHVGCMHRPGRMAGLNGVVTRGSDSERDGVRLPGTAVKRLQFGPSCYWRLDPRTSVTLGVLKEFGVRNGAEGTLATLRFARRM